MADWAHGTVYAMNRLEARMQLVRTYQEIDECGFLGW